MTRGAWRDRYERHAAGYARHLDPTLATPVERVVELARARPGVRLLDLATGTGTIARAAAARGAAVAGVDAAAGMLELARRVSPELELRRADAGALPFGANAFDVVTCGLALSHFRSREQALAEVLRVLRPGGMLVASAWAAGGSSPIRAVGEILDRYASPGHAAADAHAVDEEAWADARRGGDVLRHAGFVRVSVHTKRFFGEFADAEAALAWTLAWPLTAARVAHLDEDRRARFLREAHGDLTAAKLSWTFAFNFYVAHRPARTRSAQLGRS